MPNLTTQVVDPAIKRAKAENVRLEMADDDTEGLRIRITPTGAATWVLGCRDSEGRARRFTLGKYDKGEGGMLVAAARGAARALRADISKGADPIADARRKRLATKNAKEGIGTLKAILDLYAGKDAKPVSRKDGQPIKRWSERRQRIDSVFARYLERPISALSRTDLQLSADNWPSAQSARAAANYLRPILKWAAEREYCSEELARIKAPAPVTRRDRLLSRAELASILPELRASDSPYAAAFLFMLLTLARREEVAEARVRDVDLEAATWTISASQSKNGQIHVVPLSKQATALVKKMLGRKARKGDRLFANGAGGKLANWDRETKRIMEASDTSGWTRHDLRRAGATMLGDLGVLPDIIEASLNHVAIRSPLAATYNRSRYRPQVADALQQLADALDAINPPKNADKNKQEHAEAA